MKVLFLNTKKQKCGVYQYGKRLFDILKYTVDIEYIYKELESYGEYQEILKEDIGYDIFFYNYHPCVMEWLNSYNIQRKVKNIGLQHDLAENNIFDITLRLDVTLPERTNRYNIPRPIFENVDILLENYIPSTERIQEFINYSEGNTPIFGSFGFGFHRKGFDKMVQIVNDNYENAIIKLILPHADTAVSDMNLNQCYQNVTKPGIKLMIIHDFVEENDILYFLRSNDMNMFLYDNYPGAGLSSVIDYALSVNKPIAISDANWFRHIYSDEICLYKTNIKDILKNTGNYCERMAKNFSHVFLQNKVKSIMLVN
jgi:hypothetical protein